MLKTLITYLFVTVITVFVLGKPMMTYVAKCKVGSIAYVFDSEKEDETKKESSEEEGDVFIALHFDSGIAVQHFHSSEAKAYNDTYLHRNIIIPFVKGFHIPPEA